MPWCPNCKVEYKEGTAVCSDCNVSLVEELAKEDIYIPFFQSEDKEIAEKLQKYLNYSGLDSTIKYDADNEYYILSIPKNMDRKAQNLYQAFYYVERERIENGAASSIVAEEELPIDVIIDDREDTEDDDLLDSTNSQLYDTDKTTIYEGDTKDTSYHAKIKDEEEIENDFFNPTSSATYIMKADRYKDYNSTVIVFLTCGIAGLIFVILNALHILSIIHGLFSIITMALLFLLFIYIGVASLIKAKHLKKEAEVEKELTAKINEWLKDNVTEEFIASTYQDHLTEEVNYLKMVEVVKDKLTEQFGSQDPAYFDRLIEEFYNENFN